MHSTGEDACGFASYTQSRFTNLGGKMSWLRPLRVLSLVGVLAGWCGNGFAQQYLFTNNNVANSGNSTTALTVSGKGVVKVLKTYPTGGKSAGSGYFALSPVTSVKTRLGNCLFVSNGGDSTIAAFQMNLFNGTLTAVHGSPFKDGASGAQNFGVGLAAGGRLLFAANTHVNSISVLRINSSCSLTLLKMTDVPGSPAGMKVTPNGDYLITAYIGQVDSFKVDPATGDLTELGPFNAKGSAAGVEISCDGTTAYFGDATTTSTEVEVFSISSSGELKELNNFTNNNGKGSYNVMLSVDGKHLYVSNTTSNQITTLSVGANGALTYDSTVKLNKPGQYALGLATGTSGLDVFVSEDNPEAIGVLAASDGTLKEVPGSPFPVMKNGSDPAGLTAVPKACVLD